MVKKTTNKKVKNASPCVYDKIQFRSKLEVFCYIHLKKLGVEVKYEQERFVLLERFINSVKLFQPNSKKEFTEKEVKFAPMTYTPDFIIELNNQKFIIECKGRPNDAYPLKKKLFLKYLGQADNNIQYYFFEPHNQAQVLKTVQIIKSLIINQ